MARSKSSRCNDDGGFKAVVFSRDCTLEYLEEVFPALVPQSAFYKLSGNLTVPPAKEAV